MRASNRKRPRRLSATFVRTVSMPGRYGDAMPKLAGMRVDTVTADHVMAVLLPI